MKAPSWRMSKGPRNRTAGAVSTRRGGRPPSAAASFSALPLTGLLQSLDFPKAPLAVGLTEWIRLRLEPSTAAQSDSSRLSSCRLLEWI